VQADKQAPFEWLVDMSELEQELSAWQLSIQAGIAEGCSGADLGHYDLHLFERFTQDKLVVFCEITTGGQQ